MIGAEAHPPTQIQPAFNPKPRPQLNPHAEWEEDEAEEVETRLYSQNSTIAEVFGPISQLDQASATPVPCPRT